MASCQQASTHEDVYIYDDKIKEDSFKRDNTTVDKTPYSCAMKCEGEKVYVEAGKCPVCSKDLEN